MDLIRKLQDDQGWTDATLLDLLITYIANQQSHEALADFLEEHCFHEGEDSEPVASVKPVSREDLVHHITRALPPNTEDPSGVMAVRAHFFLGVALEELQEWGVDCYNPDVEIFAYDITRGDLIGDFISLGDRILEPREVRPILELIGNDGTYFDDE